MLRDAAVERGVSMNDYCVRKLASPSDPFALPVAAPAFQRACDMFGSELIGVVLYGSWARGEETDSSDIDLLIVVGREVKLSRQVYRIWDESPIEWNGRMVEPRFVHFPPPEETVAGWWGDVAIDGIVLFEAAFKLSMRLARIRRDIAAGRIRRYESHGQSYWVTREVA
jgi:predicted nucleotidyltransferase